MRQSQPLRSKPVHKPAILFLETVECAYENKNGGIFIDRSCKVGRLADVGVFFERFTLIHVLRTSSRPLHSSARKVCGQAIEVQAFRNFT